MPVATDRPKKPRAENRVLTAVRLWLEGLSLADFPVDVSEVVAHTPRRWLLYEPMALLPTGSFSAAPWPQLLARTTPEQQEALWRGILAALSSGTPPLTHLAVNEGIPLTRADGAGENVLRSPTGLRVLYGDFGPAQTDGPPTAEDLGRALWVQTRQNGIVQTWAPRWSMFSRGNIKEKARLLAWEQPPGKASPPWAVDLYGGIGYFVFSYARRGLRVVCWELNPWSAEALRRGAAANGWRVCTITKNEATRVDETADITLFVEDNRHAGRRLAEMAALRDGQALPVTHVNCGLLPTSRDSWATAWQAAVAGGQPTAWLHLHENVAVRDIDGRGAEIGALVSVWAATADRKTAMDHVERVKTYAPGVWHCVFDVSVAQGEHQSRATSRLRR